MNNALSLALLAGGLVPMIFGINAMNPFSSEVSKFIAGSPADRAVWMLIGGLAAASSA